MLLRIYAKCLVGQDELAKRRISEALGEPADDDGQEPDETGQRGGDSQTDGG